MNWLHFDLFVFRKFHFVGNQTLPTISILRNIPKKHRQILSCVNIEGSMDRAVCLNFSQFSKKFKRRLKKETDAFFHKTCKNIVPYQNCANWGIYGRISSCLSVRNAQQSTRRLHWMGKAVGSEEIMNSNADHLFQNILMWSSTKSGKNFLILKCIPQCSCLVFVIGESLRQRVAGA